ncbi:MAG: hypothetical protein QXP47_03680 [Candidatus Nezhaarchaeales archaeon]
MSLNSVRIESEVQRIILLNCLKSENYVSLASLAEEVSKVVRYRASAALSQNAALLERRGILEKRVEGRRVYVKIRPNYVQVVRAALNFKSPYCLISGYTWNPMEPEKLEPLKNYVDAVKKLEDEGIKVDYIVCFTTPEAQNKRKELGVTPEPNEEIVFPFKVYQSDYDRLKREIKSVVDRLIYKYEPILDITPLTKLYSDILAEISENYGLKRIYHFGPLTWLKK